MSSVGAPPRFPDIRQFRRTDTYSQMDAHYTAAAATSRAIPAINTAYLKPFVVSAPSILTAIEFYCTLAAAAHKVRLAVYKPTTNGLGACTLVSDLGEVTPTTTTLMTITGLSVQHAPGNYFMVYVGDTVAGDTYTAYEGGTGAGGGALGMQELSANTYKQNHSYTVAHTYGAFPATLNPSTLTRSDLIMILTKGLR